jgi:hypothetical protein
MSRVDFHYDGIKYTYFSNFHVGTLGQFILDIVNQRLAESQSFSEYNKEEVKEL